MTNFRFGFLGLLAALTTALNLAMIFSKSIEAAPSDVRGSGNVAVSSYTTTAGTYTLWTSGRITNTKTGKTVAPPYEAAGAGFAQASRNRGEPLGSENVAVDYVQNKDGTFTLFADGSVKKATDLGASGKAPGGGKIVFAYKAAAFGADGGRYGTWISSGFKVADHGGMSNAQLGEFEEPFEENPLVFYSVGTSVANSGGITGGPTFTLLGVKTGEKTGFGRFNQSPPWSGEWVVVIGK